MFKELLVSAWMALQPATPTYQCTLQQAEIVSSREVGVFSLSPQQGYIEFAVSHGDLTKDNLFNYDTLYEIAGQRFRANDLFFMNGKSYFSDIAWEDGSEPPSPGSYALNALVVARQEKENTVAMVGDSITWWSYGRYFRCMLENNTQGLMFIGPHTDAYGHGHAGEGGNNTYQVLDRIDKVPASRVYYVLAGTNDWPFNDPGKTVENLKEIASRLSAKGGKVLVSTLIPRIDEHREFAEDVSRRIRDWNGEGCNCSVVDVEQEISKVPVSEERFWDEGLHPTLYWYEQISIILAPHLEEALGRKK